MVEVSDQLVESGTMLQSEVNPIQFNVLFDQR